MVDALTPAAEAARSALNSGASIEQVAEAARRRLRAAQTHREGSSQELANRRDWATEPLNSLIPVP